MYALVVLVLGMAAVLLVLPEIMILIAHIIVALS
jgi:hypothetical protein